MNGVFPGAGPSFVAGLGGNRGGTGFPGGSGGPRGGASAALQVVSAVSAVALRPAAGAPAPSRAARPASPAATHSAAPAGSRAAAPGGFGGGDSTEITAALAYAKAHDPGRRWALIVSSEQAAAPSVIKGESVAAMGGFTGRETVLTPAYLVLARPLRRGPLLPARRRPRLRPRRVERRRRRRS